MQEKAHFLLEYKSGDEKGLAPGKEYELAWNLFVELRKETLEAVRMRTQIIGIKITFLSAAIGFIFATMDKVTESVGNIVKTERGVPSELLLIPAFAAIFFDLLIVNYSISIRRIGLYCRIHVEEQLRKSIPSDKLVKGFKFWEGFFEAKQIRPRVAIIANLGLTILGILPAAYALSKTHVPWVKLPFSVLLVAMFLYDTLAFLVPAAITKPTRFGNLLLRFFCEKVEKNLSSDSPSQTANG